MYRLFYCPEFIEAQLPTEVVQPMVDAVIEQQTNGQSAALEWIAARGTWSPIAIRRAIDALDSDSMRGSAASALRQAPADRIRAEHKRLTALLADSDYQTRFATAALLRHHGIPASGR